MYGKNPWQEVKMLFALQKRVKSLVLRPGMAARLWTGMQTFQT